jgi:hypothetical protein
MDASHFLVGGLTAIFVALLIWIEIRSRRNIAAQEQNEPPRVPLSEVKPTPKNRSRERR